MPFKLEAQFRQEGQRSVKGLRRSGFVPAVLYGRDVPAVSIAVKYSALEKVLKDVGENSLLELELEGDQTRPVIIHDVQTDPVHDQPIHADFLQVRLDQKIKAEVPLVFVGEAAAVKELDGVLVKSLQHIEIEALPQNLPHNIEVDISSLKTFDDHIEVAGVRVPVGVKVLSPAEQIVASVVPPRSEAELESLKTEVVEDVSKVEGVVKAEPEGESKEEPKNIKEKKESEE